MQLYGSFTSPYVRHCRIALIEAALPFEFVTVVAWEAENKSPTKKVPFLTDGGREFTDSSTIVRYVREKSGAVFMPDLAEFDLYCLANTLMDAGINIFYMEKFDHLKAEKSVVLARQEARLGTGLAELNRRTLPGQLPGNDAAIRLACFLDWGLLRKVISLETYPQLSEFLARARSWGPFAETAPPLGA